jgi:exodeoxyribonuclease VII large subunit
VVLSVSELTRRIKGLLEPSLSRVLVRGEVTGFRGANPRGHLYFSVKDAQAVIEVRIWQSLARTLRFQLKDGLAVILEGSVSVWEPAGRYNLIATRVEPEGVGARALAFEQLKARLAAEGLIGERRPPRRPLPALPRRIGVVTSISGAALRDFLQVLHRRHPRLSVLVADARVQGDGAAQEIRRAIRALGRTDVDVIVVTRGGGSVDDLWTFNEEAVARAIFECPVPVVSAVGHEIDVTLADLVADHRAPTPSAAAEALAPVLTELQLQLATARGRLQRAAQRRVLAGRHQLQGLEGALGDPRRALAQARLGIDAAADRLVDAFRRGLGSREATLQALTARLQRARPQALLLDRRQALQDLKSRLAASSRRVPAGARARLSRLTIALQRVSPAPGLERKRQHLANQRARLDEAVGRLAARDRLRLVAFGDRLDALSPLKVLARGYAIALSSEGRALRSAAEVSPGDAITVRLGQGTALDATVTGVKPARE